MSDSEEEANEKQLKIVILGDGSSGKVCIIYSCKLFLFHQNSIRIINFVLLDFDYYSVYRRAIR